MINIQEFLECDLRVGTILSAGPFPQARKPAYILSIDFGPLGIKRSSAQITARYCPDDLIGRQVIAVVNLPPKQIGQYVSECLVLGAALSDTDVVLLMPDQPVPNGTPVA